MIKKEMTLMNHKKTLASLLLLFVLAFSVILPLLSQRTLPLQISRSLSTANISTPTSHQ